MKKIGILRFLGTNCDFDILKWVTAKGYQGEFLWYQDQFNTKDYEMLILPGGFSHGDYLRSGALASKTPVMKSVAEFAKNGAPILGICNGFQILCEAGLLPGVLIQNNSQKFIDKFVNIKVQNIGNSFCRNLQLNQNLKIPIAHGDGRFYAHESNLNELMENNQIWLTYDSENPNGSAASIAGVMNDNKNVYGMMPHPERALYSWMGSTDGDLFL